MMPGMFNYRTVTKKYVFDMLQEHYIKHEKMIDRLSHYLITEEDVKEFCEIIAAAYSQGYLKAVNDYKEQLRKIGYDVSIKSS